MSVPAAQRLPPIHFVIGTGRCGSSVLHEIVCRHRDVRFLSNVDDRFGGRAGLGLARSALHRALPPSASRKGRLRFAPSEGYRALEREIGLVLTESTRDLVAADATPWLAMQTSEFFARRWPGSGVLVHKWTGWPRAGFLRKVFPDARFVHVVRDGRAVVNSWLQMPWWQGYRGPDHWQWGPLTDDQRAQWEASDRSFPVLAAILWVRLIEAAERARTLLSADCWIDVRYEDLLADPPGELRRVYDHLELSESDAGGVDRYEFGSARRAAYRHDLAQRDLAAVTSVMADVLVRHGYDLAEGAAR